MNTQTSLSPLRRARLSLPQLAILMPVILGGISLPLQATPPPGRLLAAQCFQCHGTNGQAVGGFESISGKSATGMLQELLEMSRRRPESIMDLQARAYTPDQLRLISIYLATLPAGSDDQNDD